MIKVYIPTDKEFNFKECEKLYNIHEDKMEENQPFKDIVNNTFFYSFYDDDKFLGCIYYYLKDNKLFLNCFAGRHTHLKNLECFKMSLSWFNCDVYAYSIQKTAIYGLLKCGFKKISDNIYKYERK